MVAGGGGGVKTTENKMHWPRWVQTLDAVPGLKYLGTLLQVEGRKDNQYQIDYRVFSCSQLSSPAQPNICTVFYVLFSGSAHSSTTKQMPIRARHGLIIIYRITCTGGGARLLIALSQPENISASVG